MGFFVKWKKVHITWKGNGMYCRRCEAWKAVVELVMRWDSEIVLELFVEWKRFEWRLVVL